VTTTPDMPQPEPSPASGPTISQHGRAILTGISSRAFEHPADRTALHALRSVPGFDRVLKAASGMLRERQYRLAYLASAVRVDERQFPALHALLGEVVEVLDLPARPELYVFNDPQPNALTLGIDTPFIAVNSGLYDLLDADEMRFVLGHEAGHVLSGHALYQSLLAHLLNLASAFSWVPAGGLGLRAIIAGLREWQRKAELSADRAGLLAGQDPAAALRAHMKLAGGAHLDEIDTDAFLAQGEEYEAAGDLRDGILKLLNTERTTHPFAVVRAVEVRRWIESGEYEAILSGDYLRRGDERTQTFADTAREAAQSYRKRMDDSADPLVSAVRGATETVGTAAESVVDWISRLVRPADRSGPSDGTGDEQSGPVQPPPREPA
jgi:Zn-dependent protease with chaperone function